MPINPNTCNNEVKSNFSCHTICHKKHSIFRTRTFLNQYIYIEIEDEYLSKKLEGTKNYLIYHNLCVLFDTRIQK